MTVPLAQMQLEEDVVASSRKQDRAAALSSSAMSEGSASGDTPDTSFTSDKDIESLFG